MARLPGCNVAGAIEIEAVKMGCSRATREELREIVRLGYGSGRATVRVPKRRGRRA